MGKKSKAKQAANGTKSTSDTSPFLSITSSSYVALAPTTFNRPLDGLIAEHLAPHILTYYRPLQGILLSFQNPRVSETSAANGTFATTNEDARRVLTQSHSESAVTYVWLTAEFTLFRPQVGARLRGWVNLSHPSALTLVCYNYFNAAIEAKLLPADWEWRETHYVDGKGVKVDGSVAFTAVDVEVNGDGESLTILGSMREGGRE